MNHTDTDISPPPFPGPLAITLPYVFEGEAEMLADLFRAGVGIIHLRKPDASEQEIESLLQDLLRRGVDPVCLTLHYNLSLALRFGLGGVHLRGDDFLTDNIPGELARTSNDFFETTGTGHGRRLRRSCSAHSWEEVRRWDSVVDYLFLSPLFDSVSKAGYRSSIDLRTARHELAMPRKSRVVALGGITADRITLVRNIGFDGAAVLGHLWLPESGISEDTQGEAEKIPSCARSDAAELLKKYQRLVRRWRSAAFGNLQLITDGDLSVVQHYLEGGGRWVQLRMKDRLPEEIISRGRQLLPLCRQYGAVLLINDHPAHAAAIGADGVHLGKNDRSPAEARQLLGERCIIGATANTFEDILRWSSEPVDYVGLGPFRFTTTKRNLSPVLGIEGYRKIMREMRDADIHLPLVAIGGITAEDVADLRRVGVYGVAVAGALGGAGVDITADTRRFLRELQLSRM